MTDKIAIEKAREIEELLTDLWNSARPYFSGRRLEIQSKQVMRMRVILESLAALDAEKPAEDAEAEANDLLETIEDHDSDFWETEISDLDGITTKVINVEKATSMLCQFAESYHAERCKEESAAILAASGRLGAALEESDKRR